MRKHLFTATLATLALVLASCAGFTPMYATGSAASLGLQKITLTPLEGRAGFELMRQIENRSGIRAGNADQHQLDIKLGKARRGYSVRVDNVATRYDIQLNAKWVLTDETGNTLAKMNAVGTSSYDAPDGPYAAQIAQTAAEDRAIAMLADTLLDQLGLYYARHSNQE